MTSEGLYDSIGELDICVLLDESFNLIVFLNGFDHFEALTLSSFPVSQMCSTEDNWRETKVRDTGTA